MSDAALKQRIQDLERQLTAERLATDRRNSPFKGEIEVTATPHLRNGRQGKPTVQTVENVITHRGLHWMLRAALGIHGIGATGTQALQTSTWQPSTISSGDEQLGQWVSGTTWSTTVKILVAAGIWNARFTASDYAEAQATMLGQINPFRYLILSTSSTPLVASDDAIGGTVLASRALTTSSVNHEQFMAVSSTNGFLIYTMFAAGAANGTVASIGMANYTTGARAASQAVLGSTLDGAANDIAIRYKFSYSIA